MSTTQTAARPASATRPSGATLAATLAGTRPLLGVSLRQDVSNIATWVAIVSALSASSILAYAWIFPDASDREQLSTALGANPALSLVFGPARDLMTGDGFNAWRAGQLGALFTGLMAILLVVRNSRAQEDSGQAELLASGVLARGSRLAVATIMGALASLAVGVVSFLVTIACGGGITATAVLSLTFVASGLLFTGVATAAVQLGADARAASSIATATLGVCYVLRGYIDSSTAPDWVTWLTPLGWLEKAGPATDNNPWALVPAVGLSLVLVALGFALQGRRDFGQGMVAQRAGPAAAGIAGNVWGLAIKLNRSALISWAIAFAVLGVVFGNLATSIGDVIADNPAMAAVLASGAGSTSDLTFAFVATVLEIVGIIAAVMGVQIVLRIYAEEIDYRVEPLLAASLRRPVYLASNVLLALVASTAAMALAGLGLGAVASSKDNSIAFGDVVAQALATTPAVWVLVGLATAAVGAVPSRRIIAWAGIVATFAITLLGPTFKLPGWALGISPLHHIPSVTARSPEWTELGWLALVALGLLAVGFAGYRRRDVL